MANSRDKEWKPGISWNGRNGRKAGWTAALSSDVTQVRLCMSAGSQWSHLPIAFMLFAAVFIVNIYFCFFLETGSRDKGRVKMIPKSEPRLSSLILAIEFGAYSFCGILHYKVSLCWFPSNRSKPLLVLYRSTSIHGLSLIYYKLPGWLADQLQGEQENLKAWENFVHDFFV